MKKSKKIKKTISKKIKIFLSSSLLPFLKLKNIKITKKSETFNDFRKNNLNIPEISFSGFTNNRIDRMQ